MTFPLTAATRDAPPGRGTTARRLRRWALIAAVLVTLLAGWLFIGGGASVTAALAARALARRDVPSAARWLAWSATLGSDHPRSEFLRARCARRENRYDDVARHLSRARALGYPAQALEREQWLTLAQAGQLREVSPHLPRLLTDPQGDGAEICEAFVTGYLSTYQLALAEPVLRAWEGDYPHDPLPHVIRGRIYLLSQNFAQAEAAFRLALDLDAHQAEAARGLGDVLVARQLPEEALDVYRRVPESSPEWIAAQVGRAQALIALGRAPEARSLLARVVAAHPAKYQAMHQLGQVELEAGQYEAAVERLRDADRLRPNQDETLNFLGMALRGLGRHDEAVEVLTRATKIRDARTRIDRLVERVAADPRNADLRAEIGTLHLEFGSPSEGLLWLKSALEMAPNHSAARQAIASYEARAGGADDKSRAVEGGTP